MTIDTAKEREKLAALEGHTPGPWHDDFGETYRVKSADGMNVATMNWVTLLGRLPSSEVKTNTSLIATAPDLKAKYAAALDVIDSYNRKIEQLRKAAARTNDEICQLLGKGLGYPRYADDQENFPGATCADGVYVGEHVAETLAVEALARLNAQNAEIERLRGVVEKAARIAESMCSRAYSRQQILKPNTVANEIRATLSEREP